jgi:hypothetical protein
MYTPVFALVLGLALAASLFISMAILALGNACENAWCVIATALVDTAAHIIVIALLFEPARKYLEKLNTEALRTNVLHLIRPTVDAAEREGISPAGLAQELREYAGPLSSAVLRLSPEEVDQWSEINRGVTRYLDPTREEGPEPEEAINIREHASDFVQLLQHHLPRRRWPRVWFWPT